MQESRNIQNIFVSLKTSAFKIGIISCLLFVTAPDYAVAYGGYGHSYGQGYSPSGHGYRHDGRHGYGHRKHHGYSSHYRHHGHIGTAAYVFLGILGVAVLSQILDNDNDQDRRYQKSTTYKRPAYHRSPAQYQDVLINDKSKTKPVYNYSENEAWDCLAKGDTDHALDIFAIQSQQNLHSGIPRIGFAIAAAANGETERATRAMRNALRVDASALDKININNIKPMLEMLSENYQLNLDTNKNNTDNAFMMATLAYLQEDYRTANEIISENDQSHSADKLKKLIAKKESPDRISHLPFFIIPKHQK